MTADTVKSKPTIRRSGTGFQVRGSASNTWHNVAWSPILSMYACDCADFRYRRAARREPCKHTNAVIDMLTEGTPEEQAEV